MSEIKNTEEKVSYWLFEQDHSCIIAVATVRCFTFPLRDGESGGVFEGPWLHPRVPNTDRESLQLLPWASVHTCSVWLGMPPDAGALPPFWETIFSDVSRDSLFSRNTGMFQIIVVLKKKRR